MSEARQIVKDLLDSLGLEMNSNNTYSLFRDNSDWDLNLTNERPSYWDRKSPEYESRLAAFKQEVSEKRTIFEDKLSNSDFEKITGEYGYEDGGEYCYGIIRIGDVYLKAEWSYYSYDGCEYDYICDTLRLVTPKTKTITIYE